MTRPAWVAVVVAVILVVAGHVAAAIVIVQKTTGGGTAAAAGFVMHAPSDRATRAMDALGASSVVGALPGSRQVGTASYIAAMTCDAARSRYVAPGAPLPPGAHATVQSDGIVLVDAPDGTSGVVLDDMGNGSCAYRILASPTLSVAGRGPVPSGSGFTKVGCFLAADQGGSELAAATLAGKPYVIEVGPTGGTSLNSTFDPRQGETAVVFQGTLADLQALGGATSGSDSTSTPDPALLQGRGGFYPARVTTNPDGSVQVAIISGDATGSTMTMTCTSNLTALTGPPSPTPAPGG